MSSVMLEDFLGNAKGSIDIVKDTKIETGRIIQEKRIEAGFTQKSLANALHITDKAISKWERGISLPDVSLLPKIALLLDVDLNILVATSIKQQNWVGLIDINDVDFSQIVYDKPLVYYLLSHYLLLGITNIHVITNEKNRQYLQQDEFKRFGFMFSFDLPTNQNMMILNHPWFLFGSDLTQQFQGAMLSERNMVLVLENQEPIFYFATENDDYFQNRKKFIKSVSKRTLGRGMVCIGADSQEALLDIATFVRTYQKSSGMLIGSLEEIACRQGYISEDDVIELSEQVPYGEVLRGQVNHKSVDITK